MRLSVFIVFLVASILVVGVWSGMTGASGSTIFWRIVVTLVVLQIGYFAVLMAVSLGGPAKEGDAKGETDVKAKRPDPSNSKANGGVDQTAGTQR